MKPGSLFVTCALSLALTCTAAHADPWKDESGHGRHRGHHEKHREHGEHKEAFHDGGCKVERKWEKGGDYKEEVKCKDAPWGHSDTSRPEISGHIPLPQMPAPSLPPLPQGPVYGELYQDHRGYYCREYQTRGTIGGRMQPLYGYGVDNLTPADTLVRQEDASGHRCRRLTRSQFP